MITCKKHPKYRGIRRPRAKCRKCQEIWCSMNKCDCHKHERQCCDVCTGALKAKLLGKWKDVPWPTGKQALQTGSVFPAKIDMPGYKGPGTVSFLPCLFFVYILKCRDGTFYTGYTTDLKKRLEAHNSGKGAKYTRGRGPCSLEFQITFATKSEAMKKEAWIKSLSRLEKLTLMA